MHRILAPGVFLIASIGLVPSADAQLFPFFRRPSDMDAPRRGGNPELERKKTDADKAIQSGDFNKTIELTDQVLRQDPTDAVAYYLRGSARVEIGIRVNDSKLVRDGVADAREAIRNDKKRTAMYYLPYLYGMKSLTLLEGSPEHAKTAVTVANQILAVPNLSNDEKSNLLYQRAQAQAVLNKIDPAVADMEEALKLAPTHFGARAALAEMLARAGRIEPATAAFNKLVETFPENPLTYNNRGMFFQNQGKYDEAVLDFTRAVERDPNYIYSYVNRGNAFLLQGNGTAAEADFTQAMKLNPPPPMMQTLYTFRSQAKMARGDLEGATIDQRTAVDVNPKDLIVHADLGFLLFYGNDFQGALQEFNTALEMDPQFRQVQPWRVVCLARLGRIGEAKEKFADVIKKPAKQRDWGDSLIAYLLGSEPESELLAATGTAQGPFKNDELCEAHYFIAVLQSGAGKTSEARDAYQHAIDTKSRQLAAFRGAQFALKKSASSAGAEIPTAVKTPLNGTSK